jgi:pantoate--beta-alanine ligase
VIVRRLIADLDVPVELVVCPTVREPDGLALSSRNRYLDPDQRREAVALYAALSAGRALVERGERDPARVEAAMAERLRAARGAEPDYARAVAADSLEKPGRLAGPTLLLVAARFGTTRLIDNFLIDVPESV